MIKNYFKIAFRNLAKSKLYSSINITGLAAGMAIAMLIGFWIVDEWTFDKQFHNHTHIAQVWQNTVNNGTVGSGYNEPYPLGETLRKDYGSDFKYVAVSTWNQTHILSRGDKHLSSVGIFCEPDLPKMLAPRMLAGANDLTGINTILLSHSQAKACFGDADPLHQTLQIDNKTAVEVMGVYEDMPYNSSFAQVGFMLPFEQYARNEGLYTNDNPWRANSFRAYVQIADHARMATVSAKIRDVKLHHVHADEQNFHPQLFLHPMDRWRLFSEFKNGVNTGGLIRYVWLFGMSGLFVLLLACINFMNLSTARSEKRAKEVGIRKTIGSERRQLIAQFFCESLLMTSIALVFALLLAQLLLPLFNNVADKQISLLWGSPLFWLICIGFSLVTAMIAGSYPALYLSSFRPVKVLKGTFRAGRAAVIPRRVLVVVQFSVSIVLIIATIVVFRQVKFAESRPIGYDRNGLVMLPMYTYDIHEHFDAVKHDLLATGAILNMAESWSPVTSVWSTNSGFSWEGRDPNMALDFPNDGISYDYGKTVGWQFVAGRDFDRSFAGDSAAFVINEAAAKFMGLKNPIGARVTWDDEPYTIIGIIKNVIAESPYEAVRPSLFHINNDPGTRMIVRINPRVNAAEALRKTEAVFKQYSPQQPFDYQFVDQEYAQKFGDEQRFGKLASVFSILAILISCLGLFGMASFIAEQRTKEIGVRKVLGATLFSLWRLLSSDFLVLVLISLGIALPLAYFSMAGWLQHYEYRTTLSWWIFAAGGLGTLAITLLTVSYQAIKAAMMDPVKSLRTE